MEIPSLVRHGLWRDFNNGYNSDATRMMYEHTKKSPEVIEQMIRETWDYIREKDKSSHVFSHFLYLLSNEVEREWVKDISLDIVKQGLNHGSVEVVDSVIGLVEIWSDKDILDLLYNTEIKTKWLHDYKVQVLQDYGYYKGEKA